MRPGPTTMSSVSPASQVEIPRWAPERCSSAAAAGISSMNDLAAAVSVMAELVRGLARVAWSWAQIRSTATCARDGGCAGITARSMILTARRTASSAGREGIVEPLEKQLDVAGRQAHRRLDLEHVVERALGGEEHAAVAQVLDHRARLGRGRLERVTVAHQFGADEKSKAPDVADDRVAPRQGLQ